MRRPAGRAPRHLVDLGTVVTIVIALASALGGGGVIWGAFRTEFRHLQTRVEAAEAAGTRAEQASRDYERQAADGMVEAVKAMSAAVEHLANWGVRYEERMARVEARARSNRAAIRRFDQARGEEAKRKLARAGVPAEVLEEVSDVLGPRIWDPSEPTTLPREDSKR